MNNYWEASLCPLDPDNFWVDDATGERVNAETGERMQYTEQQRADLHSLNESN